MTGTLRSASLEGPAGRLEALWKEAAGPRRGGALFAHPHPLHGGTLHNKVVFRAAKALTAAGWTTLRFNFRGVGASEGRYDDGKGEVEDYRAALDEVAARAGLPILAGGFSFGSAVALRAIQGDRRVAAFVGVGLPVATASGSALPPLPADLPALFVVGDRDVYGPPERLRAALAGAAAARIVEVAGADHFFEGKLDALEDAIFEFARAVAAPAPREGSVGA